MGVNGGKWRGSGGKGQKRGIREHIRIEIYIKTSEIWRRWGRIGENTGKIRGILGVKLQNVQSNNTFVDYNHGGGGTGPLKQTDM